jgi:hypothetical protein
MLKFLPKATKLDSLSIFVGEKQKMPSNRNVIWIMIAACLFLGGAFYYWYGQGKQNQFRWEETWPYKSYSEKDREPYGTHIASGLFSKLFSGKQYHTISKKLSEELPLDSTQHLNYVFVGEGLFMDSSDTKRLLDFVALGHTAFLSSKTIPFDLMFSLYYEECEEAAWNDYAYLVQDQARVEIPLDNGQKAQANLHFATRNKVQPYKWHFIPSKYFCAELPHQPIGMLNDTLVNFALFPYGNGRFLLHTQPLAFSNYSLLRPETRPYVEALLSWLPEGDVYWDAYSRVPELVARNRNRQEQGSQPETGHPFTYILQQPALAWAWYILLALAILWFLFRSKRRQRIIPVLPKKENTSYEFIQIISNLHFRERNYGGISVQRMKQFLAHVRDRYHMTAHLDAHTGQVQMEPNYLTRLSKISGASEQTLKNIFDRYRAIAQFEATEEMMVDLHLAIEKYFTETKKK